MSSTPFVAPAMLVVLITLRSQPGKAAPTLADVDPERDAGGKRAAAGYVGKQEAKELALASIAKGIAKDVKSLVHINKEKYKNCRSDKCCEGLWCYASMQRCGSPPEMTLKA